MDGPVILHIGFDLDHEDQELDLFAAASPLAPMKFDGADFRTPTVTYTAWSASSSWRLADHKLVETTEAVMSETASFERYVNRTFLPRLLRARDENWLYAHLQRSIRKDESTPFGLWQMIVWAAERGVGEDAQFAADALVGRFWEPWMSKVPFNMVDDIRRVAEEYGNFSVPEIPT
jgi:hypothetical protein